MGNVVAGHLVALYVGSAASGKFKAFICEALVRRI